MSGEPLDAPGLPGWHGKLPSLGDFASRRLSPDFITAWDGWLAAGLAALREQQPSQWLNDYLACPTWRFVLMPGVLPGPMRAQAHAGVLMPSVDRTGRYFPLTVVTSLPSPPQDALTLTALLTWLHDLDDLAADALQDDWTIDRLEAELARCRCPQWSAPGTAGATDGLLPGPGESQRRHTVQGTQALVARLAQAQSAAFLQASEGHAYWWADSQSGDRRLIITRGLPPPQEMRALFGPAPAAA